MANAFQQRHFEQIARLIKELGAYGMSKAEISVVASSFADHFKRDNPKFKRSLFMKACGSEDCA